MSVECINEPVEVRVDFLGPHVLPRAMHWNKQLYSIKNVNMVHSIHDGDSKLFFFSVSDQTNYFKLQFDTSSLQWRLIEMYAE